MRTHREEGHPARLEIRKQKRKVNEKYFAVVKNFGGKLSLMVSAREFQVRQIWRRNENGSMSVAFWPNQDVVDYSGSRFASRLVRGTSCGIFTATNIDGIGGVPQCKLEFMQYMDAGGFIPVSLINRLAPRQLKLIWSVKDRFRRDREVDEVNLTSLRDVIKNEHQSYSFAEHALIKRGMDFFRMGIESDNATEQNSTDARVSLKEVELDVDSDRVFAGVVQATIHTDPVSCVAYEFDKELREKMSKLNSKRVSSQVVKKLNSHAQLYRRVWATGVPGFAYRDSRMKVVWQKDEEGNFWIVYEDTNLLDAEIPFAKDHARCSFHAAWKLEARQGKDGSPQTMATVLMRADFGGSLPTKSSKLLLRSFCNTVIDLRMRFDRR